MTSKNSTVLDFGCGGGYLLKNLDCHKKYGVEINESARTTAIRNGIECFSRLEEIPDNEIDVIISNHCLEHVTNPYDVLSQMQRVLKPEGKIVIVVPSERTTKLVENDGDNHLYTWTAQNLRNLVTASGYTVISAETIKHKWPLYFVQVQRVLGWRLFHVICRTYSKLSRKGYQVRVVAKMNK